MNAESGRTGLPELHCLLCESASFAVVWKLKGADVRSLWKATGRNLSERAFGALTSDRDVTQLECRACGFRFFDPALAGGSRFYEELEQGEYYSEDRPEFDFALKLCRREQAKSVLDVGGGEGAFL